MMKYFLLFLSCVFLSVAHADVPTIELEKAPINWHDMESVKRGAKFFANTCMACHTAVYLRYNKLAQEAGVTYEKMPVNVKNWPYGVSPPDLSLEADLRGVDWIYTYLHCFYVDKKRPSGVNNLLVPNTAMPGIIQAFQGQQVLATDLQQSQQVYGDNLQWFDVLILQSQGVMTSAQFDQTIADVVNFLAYAAEPYHQAQFSLGYWVIGFLVILFVFVYALKKSYWKMLGTHKKSKKKKT